jgi:serine/threonine protein kinase
MPQPPSDHPAGDDAQRADGERTASYSPPPSPPAEDDAVSLFDGTAEPTDDSPTVISKGAPRPADDQLATGLRGRRLAHFELIEPIGVGGMAAVLRARDTQLDRNVALKILPPDMAADPENVRRFHQEARSAAKLDHENIARVFFCGEDQRLHFIAFEFVEGENLRMILDRRGRLPVTEALNYMLQIAAGLAHAAGRGVVHRDIKPSNIIISSNGRAKLVDMGLARSLDPQHDLGLTQSGVTLGTFDYVSPEQALEPRDADVRSDIYSLGCTFYHVLTGVPPVPDGTAAKKLHHHQHVKPVDPRQLVPDLPDEVAVILDRMMAKNPKDRYQTPEHLVHHLVLAAKKLGAAAEVPEGVLFVDAPLPNPPASRPVVLAALLAAAVVGLILILEQTSQQPPPADPTGPHPKTAANNDKGPPPGGAPVVPPNPEKDPPKEKSDGPDRVAAVPVYDADPPTYAGLTKFLEDHKGAPEIEILLARDLDLSAPDEERPFGGLTAPPGLVVTARRVTIRPKTLGTRPTLLLTYDGRPTTAPWVALTIVSDKALVQGVRVVVDARMSRVEMTGLLLRGREHRVEDCQFVQAGSLADENVGMASVVLASEETAPSLTLTRCAFLGFEKLRPPADGRGQPGAVAFEPVGPGGRDGLVRRGAGALDLENCVFGPHAAAIRLENGRDAKVEMRHCSVLAAGTSAVFHLHEETGVTLDVQHCLVSRPGEPNPEGPAGSVGAVVVRQTGSSGPAHVQGQDNRYHNLDAYWASADGRDDIGLDGFAAKLLEKQKGKDSSHVLKENPWKNDPLKMLEEQQLARAFQVNDRLRELRVDGDRKQKRLIGAERCGGENYLTKLTELEEKKPEILANQRIVEPGQDDSSNRIYSTLDKAILAANPGDVILIKYTGKPTEALAVGSIRLEKEAIDLTIKPFPGYQPVLTIGKARDADAALFRLHDGKLHLEKLEFRLEPGSLPFKAQAVVALVGDGQCDFKDCVVTLNREGSDALLSVLTLPKPGESMRMDVGEPARQPGQGPQVSLTNCFVRGDGDLILGRMSRPFELKADNVLAALNGAFLNVEASQETATTGQTATLNLNRVTTYLTSHLVRLQGGKELKGLVPVQLNPDGCLFVAAADRALLHLDGPETVEEELFKKKFLWTAGKGVNVFGNFNDMLDQQPGGGEMPRPSVGWEKWRTLTNDSAARALRIKATNLPPAEGPFSRITPSQFKPIEPSGSGADVGALPRPADEAAESK